MAQRFERQQFDYSLKDAFKGGVIFAAGQVLTKSLSFFLVPLYAHFLSTEDYGIVGFFDVWGNIGFVVLMLGLYGAQTRLVVERTGDSEAEGRLLSSLNLYVALACSLGFCVVVGTGRFWGDALLPDDVQVFPHVATIAGTVCFRVFNQLCISYYVAKRRYVYTMVSQIVLFALTSGAVVFFVAISGQGALGKFRGALVGNAAFFAIFYWNYARRFRLPICVRDLRESIQFGIPLSVHLLAAVAHQWVGMLILKGVGGFAELGLYNLAMQASVAMGVVITSANRAWNPSYYALMSREGLDREREVRRAAAVWLVLVGGLCLIGGLYARAVLAFVVPPSFLPSSRLVPPVLLGQLFNALYFVASGPLFFYKRTRVMPFLTGSVAVVNALSVALLAERWGATGAAHANLVSYALLAIGAFVLSKRLFNPHFELGRIVLVLAMAALPTLIPALQAPGAATEGVRAGIVLFYVACSFTLFRGYLAPPVVNAWTRLRLQDGRR